MLLQFHGCCLPQRIKENSHAFASREFEGGDEIAITGHDDDRSNHFSQCQPGDVHANPHVNAFLFNIKFEIVIFQDSFCLDAISSRPFLEAPTIVTKNRFAEAECKVWRYLKLVV